MSEPRFRCGFGECCFATDDFSELALHDLLDGHPNPSGAPLDYALIRYDPQSRHRDIYVPETGGPGVPLAPSGIVLPCRSHGCDFSAADWNERVIHELTVHGFACVRSLPQRQFRELLAAEICSALGHCPSPVEPSACVTCGARLEEVLHG